MQKYTTWRGVGCLKQGAGCTVHVVLGAREKVNPCESLPNRIVRGTGLG